MRSPSTRPLTLSLLLCAGLSAARASAQEVAPPPLDLQALPQAWKVATLLQESEDRYLRVGVALSTRDKRVHFRWTAKAGPEARELSRRTSLEASFFPTACDFSKADPRVWVIAGRSTGPVLEEWTVGEILLGVRMLENGTQFTTLNGGRFTGPNGLRFNDLDPPSITRAALPIDSSLGQIADIATNKWDRQGKHLLVLDWDAGTVFALDRSTGRKSVSIDPAVHPIARYRTLRLDEHSHFGAVCRLFQRPFWIASPGQRSGISDPDFFALCDVDEDGVWDTHFVIPWASWASHELFTLGEFED